MIALIVIGGILLALLLAGILLLARFGERAFSWGSSKWEHDDPELTAMGAALISRESRDRPPLRDSHPTHVNLL